MNSNLIKIFAFFIGLFITLIIISYIKINESFTDISSSSSLSTLSSPIIGISSPISTIATIVNKISNLTDDNINDDSILPYKGYKFMCINTYKNIDTISITDGKWYDIDITMNYIDYNYNNYFKFSKLINLESNKLNKKIGVKGADISGIELLGPSCFNFANNNDTYELTIPVAVPFCSFPDVSIYVYLIFL